MYCISSEIYYHCLKKHGEVKKSNRLSNIILAFFFEHFSEVKAWSIIRAFLSLEFSWKEEETIIFQRKWKKFLRKNKHLNSKFQKDE